MFKIDEESTKKLLEINNLLNRLNLNGAQNVGILYNVFVMLQEVIQRIQDLNKPEDGISIDNTKGGK